MGKIIVIGAGLSGLSASAYLAKAGQAVELLESSPKPGGRAYSFPDPQSNDIIDNGQHIMMGCYINTFDFLKIIGSLDSIYIQPELNVNFVSRDLSITPLKAKSKLYPLNLFWGLLNYKAIDIKDRLKVLLLLSKLPFIRESSLNGKPILSWLLEEGQSPAAIKAFWEILAVGTLNSGIERASSVLFIQILKQMFLSGNKAASIVLPGSDLSSMYCPAAIKYIMNNNGAVFLSEPVKSLQINSGKVEKIHTLKREITDFDYVISAVPAHSLQKILPENYLKDIVSDQISYSAILSAHIWLKNNYFSERFYGLIDSPVHWVFNHKKFITIVISNADRFVENSKEEILQVIISELKSYFSFFCDDDILYSRVIKEKRATFIPDDSVLSNRPGVKTSLSNFFLAGDWTATGLPATIEGAVKSGRTAAGQILKLI